MRKHRAYNKFAMKYLLASDIHGDVDAVKLLIKKYHELKCDKLLLLGDYFSFSREDDNQIIDILNLFKNDVIAIKGNCDNFFADDVFDFDLRSQFFVRLGERNYCFVHGDNLDENIDCIMGVNNTYVVYGHTDRVRTYNSGGINFINIGSISLPRGGSKKCYAIVDENCFKIYSEKDELILAI